MSRMTDPMQIATIANTLVWPLVVGVAVVLWRRARKRAAMQARLQGSYRDIETQPVPDNLALVLEALDEGEELAPGGRADGKAGAATPTDS
jgi:hypothetical protein